MSAERLAPDLVLLVEQMDAGNVPMLPFEAQILQDYYDALVRKQRELGERYGESMQQGAEDTHDNHPAEALRDEATVLAERARLAGRSLLRKVVFDYPAANSAYVTLGSIVDVIFPEEQEVVTTLLTGCTTELPGNDIEAPSPELCTIGSPLGRVLLGAVSGASISCRVGEREINAEVGRVQVLEESHARGLIAKQ